MNIKECMNVEVEADGKPWYHDIKTYIKNSEYPPNATDSEKKFIQHMACQFFLSREVLYKRCWKIWFCISHKTHSGSNKHGSTSIMKDNM